MLPLLCAAAARVAVALYVHHAVLRRRHRAFLPMCLCYSIVSSFG